MEDRLEKALHLSEELLEGIELESITTSSAILKCIRLARLADDVEAMQWLQYEISGYPLTPDGFIESDAFRIAWKMGRGYYNDEKEKRMFTELAQELEQQSEALRLSIGTVTTNGASVSGEYCVAAMNNLTSSALNHTNNVKSQITRNQKRLSILRGQYYQYALKVNIELNFSKGTGKIFDVYRKKADIELMKLVPASIQKLQAVYESIDSNNQEKWSQALTSCRRLFEDVSNALFDKYFPDFNEEKYRTKSGKELKITGDNYVNRLYAVVDGIQNKAANNTLVGTHILYTVDWVENLHDQLCKGVHTDITYDEAMRGILHCYICLGDLVSIARDTL